MAAVIATVRGELHLTVGDSVPILMGTVEIPITAEGQTGKDGELVLRAKPNLREIREFVEVVFGDSRYQHAENEEGS